MTLLAVHRPTGARYVFLGVAAQSFTPSAPLPVEARRAKALPPPRTISAAMAAVCDAEGAIHWFRSEELTITEVDGHTPAALLRAAAYR
jgi:hypothetical protein